MRPLVSLVVPLLAAALHGPALAQPAVRLAQADLRLLAGWVEPDGTRVAGLEIALADGWKTYWRAPGASGLPPVFDWAASRNVEAVSVEWPAPSLFDSFGITTIGYDGTLVLPLRVTPTGTDGPVHLAVTLDFGVCADICIPARAELALDLPPALEADEATIHAHRARVPRRGDAHGLTAACGVLGAGVERRFAARLGFERRPDSEPTILVEGPHDVWIGPMESHWSGNVLHATAEAEVYTENGWVSRDALRLTLLWPGTALDVQGCAPL
jgi:DsbC/DsbD-like thiol-disulfide interchange protein